MQEFGTLPDGRNVQVVTLRDGPLLARVLTLGGALQDLRLAGTPWPLVLGSESLAAYLGPLAWCGTVVGPVGNRLSPRALEAVGYSGTREVLLHSGPEGVSGRIWQIAARNGSSVTLTLALRDGEGGFPGTRALSATYALRDGALWLTLSAETDRDTPMNLVHHPYWALDGTGGTEGQRLTVFAQDYLPTDEVLLPLPPAPVAGTPFDLRQGGLLAPRPRFDTNFCLSPAPRAPRLAARLEGRKGVTLEIETTAPGLQVYDGRALTSGSFPGLTGSPFGPFDGVALEPQMWPDAPANPGFPSIMLRPGATFRQETCYRLARKA